MCKLAGACAGLRLLANVLAQGRVHAQVCGCMCRLEGVCAGLRVHAQAFSGACAALFMFFLNDGEEDFLMHGRSHVQQIQKSGDRAMFSSKYCDHHTAPQAKCFSDAF